MGPFGKRFTYTPCDEKSNNTTHTCSDNPNMESVAGKRGDGRVAAQADGTGGGSAPAQPCCCAVRGVEGVRGRERGAEEAGGQGVDAGGTAGDGLADESVEEGGSDEQKAQPGAEEGRRAAWRQSHRVGFLGMEAARDGSAAKAPVGAIGSRQGVCVDVAGGNRSLESERGAVCGAGSDRAGCSAEAAGRGDA